MSYRGGWRAKPGEGSGTPNPLLVNRDIQIENAKWPHALVEVKQLILLPPAFSAVPGPKKPVRTWRNRRHLVQEFIDGRYHRLMVIRLALDVDGRIVDDTTWSDLERLKGEAGYGDRYAVEVFPPAEQAPAVPQARHLWLLKKRPPYGFHTQRAQP